MRQEERDLAKKEMAKRIGYIDISPPKKRGRGIVWYIIILLIFSLFAVYSIELFLLIVLLISLIYVPFLFAIRNSPKTQVDLEERIIVDEDIAHFREIANKALKGNAVAQRDIELRVLNTLAIDLSIRYELPEKIVRRNLENPEFLEKYINNSAVIAAKMFGRRHNLRVVLPKERFLKEINVILEAIE